MTQIEVDISGLHCLMSLEWLVSMGDGGCASYAKMPVIFFFFSFGNLKREKDKKVIHIKNDKKVFAFIVMLICYIK